MKLSRVEQREKEKAGKKGRAIIRAPVSCGRTTESGRKVQVEPWSGGKQVLYIGKERGREATALGLLRKQLTCVILT